MTLEAWAEGARWATAGILVVSAITKLARRGGRAARAHDARTLGVPDRLAAILALALAPLELGLAALSVAVPNRLAVVPAVIFLGAVTVLVARAVRRGVSTPCQCFGGLQTRPLSSWTVARNLALLAIAIVALASPGPLGAPTFTALVWFVVAFGIVVLG